MLFYYLMILAPAFLISSMALSESDGDTLTPRQPWSKRRTLKPFFKASRTNALTQ